MLQGLDKPVPSAPTTLYAAVVTKARPALHAARKRCPGRDRACRGPQMDARDRPG